MTDNSDDMQYIAADEYNLRLLINNTDDPIWLVDTNHKILECNASFRKWVACFIGCELDKGDDVLFGRQNISYTQKFEMCYQLALMGRTFRSVEDIRVGDALLYTSVSFNPVRDNTGAIIGVSCFARDITEQRRHLLKIEEQNLALREIANIESHKMRGPLATILGLQQFFNYDNLADPLNGELMAGIELLSHQLDNIIKEVVRMSNEIDK